MPTDVLKDLGQREYAVCCSICVLGLNRRTFSVYICPQIVLRSNYTNTLLSLDWLWSQQWARTMIWCLVQCNDEVADPLMWMKNSACGFPEDNWPLYWILEQSFALPEVKPPAQPSSCLPWHICQLSCKIPPKIYVYFYHFSNIVREIMWTLHFEPIQHTNHEG